MKNTFLYKKALRIAVPMMIQNGITNMVTLIDNIMVGSLSTEAMTAVSVVGQLIFVFNLGIFGGISGPSIYGAQYYGQKNTEGMRNTFRLKYWISLICLVAGMIVFIFGGEYLIGLYLKGESTTINKDLTTQYGMQYLMIMLAGLAPFVITQIYASSLRETGESVKPMVAGIVSVFIDIVFNYLLIYGKFGFPELGVKGAAVATVLARIVEMAVVVIWSHAASSKHVFLKNVYHTMKVPLKIALEIIKKGTPIFFNEFLWAGGVAVLTQCYSRRGTEIVTGLNISNVMCNLLNVVFIALGSAVGILTGQTLGASEYKKAQKEAFSLMWLSGGICILLSAILISVSGVFPELYNTTEQIRSYGQSFIIITALFFPVQGFLNALYFTLRSGGKTLTTFLFDSVYSWVISVPLAALLVLFSPLNIFVIYAIVQAVDIIKVIIGYIMIKKGLWISNLVENKTS